MSEGGNGDPEAASGEFAAIERIRRLLPPPPDGDVWVGDDAAVVSMPGGERLLFAADCVVEGVHFDLDLVRPADVGWKALAVNVSDIAAMGGRPLQAVVTVVGAGGDLLDELMGGLAEAAVAFGCDVVGGDLSSGSCIVVSVAITGTPGDRGAVLRSRARAGDLIYVTGPLGRSAAGLRALQAGQRTGRGDETVDGLIAAHRRPVARVAEGLAAAAAGATAMIDISDGLGIDLDHLATASAIGVALEAVPVADGASSRRRARRWRGLRARLRSPRSGARGEDLRGRRVAPADPNGRLRPGSDRQACRCGPATGQGLGAPPAAGVRLRRGGAVGEDSPGRLHDPPRANARGADVQVGRRAVHESAYPLDVRVPASLGAPVGVGDVHPEARAFPTEFTDSCHDDAFLERVPTTGRRVTLASSGMEPCEPEPRPPASPRRGALR